MADIESELVERKESLGKAPAGKYGPIERIREAVCAFANDLPEHGRPGVVLVGQRGDPPDMDRTGRVRYASFRTFPALD